MMALTGDILLITDSYIFASVLSSDLELARLPSGSAAGSAR